MADDDFVQFYWTWFKKVDEMSRNLRALWMLSDTGVDAAAMDYYVDIKHPLIFPITINGESEFMCINLFSQHATSSLNVDKWVWHDLGFRSIPVRFRILDWMHRTLPKLK